MGKFVKLHSSTERCTRLDVARVLLEVNLHEPLVELVTFTDREGTLVEVGVSFQWFPTCCNVCSKWGHKGTECNSKQITMKTRIEEARSSGECSGQNVPNVEVWRVMREQGLLFMDRMTPQ